MTTTSARPRTRPALPSLSTYPPSPLQLNLQTSEPFLVLPAPHSNIIITPPRLSDTSSIVEVLNDFEVTKALIGPPYPYTCEHAKEWLASIMLDCDRVLEKLRHPSMEPNWLDGVPVRTIRELQPDGSETFLGDIGILRSRRFQYLRNAEKERKAVEINLGRGAGDKDIIWEFAYYLRASHHGRGIMSLAVQTLLHAWAVPHMNAHVVHGVVSTGNEGSVKVFLKNGFKQFDLVENSIQMSESKGGGIFGQRFLEWQKQEEKEDAWRK